MMYTLHYDSPLGGILLAADEIGLTGLWFDGEKYFADGLDPEHTAQETLILREATELHPTAPSHRLALPAGGLGAAAPNPLRPDHDLRCIGKATGGKARPSPDVGTGRGRCGRT